MEIETLQRTWYEFKSEHGKGRGADPTVLARINQQIDEYEDATRGSRREALASRASRTDTTFGPGLFTGSTTSTWDREARERAGSFWTWARYGFEDGRGDP